MTTRTDTQPAQPSRDVILLLALCPLLAVSDTLAHALAIGVYMLITCVVAGLVAPVIARRIAAPLQLAAVLLIVAAVVAAIALLANAFLPGLHESLGIYLLLIISNSWLLMSLTPQDASDTARGNGLLDITGTSAAVAGILLAIGLAREVVGRGSIFHDAARLFGAAAGGLDLQLFRADMGFLLAMLPPGAFIALGLLLALRNGWARRKLRPRAAGVRLQPEK